MSVQQNRGGAGFSGAVHRLVTGWALLGGALLLTVVAINMLSVIGSIFGTSFPGDFELTEVGVAIAAFSFLPYCQATGANVTADIFTSGASTRGIAFFTLLGSLVALGFSVIMIWRMYLGMLDQKEYDYTTTILQIPHWWAFLPILVSLGLLALAALSTLIGDFNTMTKRTTHRV